MLFVGLVGRVMEAIVTIVCFEKCGVCFERLRRIMAML